MDISGPAFGCSPGLQRASTIQRHNSSPKSNIIPKAGLTSSNGYLRTDPGSGSFSSLSGFPRVFPNATEKESTAEKGGHQPVLGYWCLGLAAGLRAKWPRRGQYGRLVSRLQKHHCFQKGGEDVQSRLHHLPWRALHSGEFSPTLFIKVYLPCWCLLLMKWSHGLPSLSVCRTKSFENVILKQKP